MEEGDFFYLIKPFAHQVLLRIVVAAIEVPVTVPSMQNLRIVLNWADPEVIIFPSDGLATAALVNDLDVKVITPSGDTVLPYVLDKTEPDDPATRAVNTLDNTEMVEIANAAPGTYTIVVAGTRITAQAPQQFVLVSNADMTAVTPCVDEANNSAATASRITISAVSAGRACAAGDVDYFTFTANQPGPISITVTATDTALRATLTGGSADMSIDVPAGQARLLLASHGSTTQTEYFLRVEPIGTIGTDTFYTITADYPYNPGARRRAVGR